MSVWIGAAPTTAPAATEQETWNQNKNHSGKQCFGSGSVSGSGLDPTTAPAATDQEAWHQHENHSGKQCFGSGSVSGSGLDPDPGRQKQPKKIKKVNKFHFLKCSMFSFEIWRLPLQLRRPLWRVRDKSPVFFLKVLVIKTRDPDWIRIGSGWIRIQIHNTTGSYKTTLKTKRKNFCCCTKLPTVRYLVSVLINYNYKSLNCLNQCCGSGVKS